MAPDFASDIAAVRSIDVVPKLLDVVCRITGLGFAAVARVTDTHWVVCESLDRMGFGLGPGSELKLATTICNEIRVSHRSVVISDVETDAEYCTHPTPEMYGFRSYVSVPIVLPDGSFFGTLCAIDRDPAKLDEPQVLPLFEAFAELIALHLHGHERLSVSLEKHRETEELLRESQKMETVGHLTAGLAHDFNNVLVGISNAFEMMRRRLSQGRIADLERYLVAGQQDVKRATALTTRLLAFARRQTLAPHASDVGLIVTSMLDLVRRTVGERLTVTMTSADALWPTVVDPSQLENAVLNLCINARDAMPEGGKLTIGVSNRSIDRDEGAHLGVEAGDYVHLCVEDTGTGMPPEVVAVAFNPFFTTKAAGTGTGLGLSMVSSFAKQRGGYALIDSTVGEGTTVSLLLKRQH